MPGSPVTFDTSLCGAGNVLLMSTPGNNGDINRWYENPTGGPLLVENNQYSTPVLSVNTDYWVSSINHSTGCESYRRQVNVTINAVPELPVVTDIKHCGNISVHLTAITGNFGTTNRWYDASSGGNMLAESDTFITPVLTNTITYWVSSFNAITGCESNRTPIRVQIDPIPGIPIVADTGRCGEGILTLEAVAGVNGTVIHWFDAASGGTMLGNDSIYTTPYLTNTTTYWLSTVNEISGCESPRIRVTASIYPVPGYPDAADVANCGPDTLILQSMPGSNASINRWYDSISGGTLLLQYNDYETEYLTATRRYYVASYNEITGCESSRREVIAAILPVPVANTIIGPESVGINQTNVIYSVNFHPGSTYDWDVPPGINLLLENQNFIIVEFPNLGNYNLSVTETNSIGCVGPPAHKPIEVKVDVIALNIASKHQNACMGINQQVSVAPTGGTPSYTFLWGGDVQYLNQVNISNPVFNSPVAGDYILTITVNDINLNAATDTIYLTVYPNPLAQVISSDSITCAGSNLPLNTNVTGGSGIYTAYMWSGQTTPLSDIMNPNPVFNTFIRGNYFLKFTVTDSHGCSDADSITVVNDAPQSAFTSDAKPGCSPLPVQFANQSDNAVSYLWNFGDGNSSNQENPMHRFNNQTNSVQYYNVQLTAISINNCVHVSNDYVTVYPNPELEISRYPENACSPADILLSSTPGGYSYNWDFGDGNSESGNFNVLHTFVNDADFDTTFLIRLVSTSYFGCEDTGTTEITVHPSPVASFTVDPESQMIPDKTIHIVNTTPEGPWNYQWRFGDDNTSVLRDPESHVYPGPGNYLIYLVVKSSHCADSIWSSIEILPHPPIAAFKPVEPGCMPLTIQFENTSAYSTTFLWEFGDGAVSNKPNPEYTYYEPGSYTIKLTAWSYDGSSDSYSTVNDVYVLPNAFFDIKPRRVYANEQPVLFDNQSDNGAFPVEGNRYLWDFGDGAGSDANSPVHMYQRAGNYDVTLNVWTDKGCYDVYEYKAAVLVEPIGRIVFPNVFSPEAQLEENKVFKPGIIDFVDDYHLMIFNRWGELIFESFNQDTGWDGMVNGEVAKEDVYVWKVEGKYTNGQTFVLTGDVTLLR
jgi:gliding motility-associated-like protein